MTELTRLMETHVVEPYVRRHKTSAGGTGSRSDTHAGREAVDREQLLERLHELRVLVPAFAQELAGVRRVAARLRRDNKRLLAEVQRLQAKHDGDRT